MKLAGPEVWERWTALVSTAADQSDGNSACEASCHGRAIPERTRELEREKGVGDFATGGWCVPLR